ncbi:MAG TPA: hypothetical protein VFG53_05690 [Anaeromyxobacter sp.]|nr:hypothetical protein [Anaeromyxobacter sp.]
MAEMKGSQDKSATAAADSKAGEPAAEFRKFLVDLAVDPAKLGSFIKDPDAAMKAAGIGEIDQLILKSGNPATIHARLSGQQFAVSSAAVPPTLVIDLVRPADGQEAQPVVRSVAPSGQWSANMFPNTPLQVVPQVVPQILPQVVHPQIFPQVVYPQIFPQVVYPQIFPQVVHPQIFPQVVHPQIFPQVVHPQIFPQVVHPQIFPQVVHPQIFPQVVHPQIFPQVHPQILPQVSPQVVVFPEVPSQVGRPIPLQVYPQIYPMIFSW